MNVFGSLQFNKNKSENIHSEFLITFSLKNEIVYLHICPSMSLSILDSYFGFSEVLASRMIAYSSYILSEDCLIFAD